MRASQMQLPQDFRVSLKFPMDWEIMKMCVNGNKNCHLFGIYYVLGSEVVFAFGEGEVLTLAGWLQKPFVFLALEAARQRTLSSLESQRDS